MLVVKNAVLNGAETDIAIENGKIVSIGGECRGGEVFDARGLSVCAGLVDMHVHMREPGFEYKEDIESASHAAAAGGVTSAACMPNTKPVIDDPRGVEYILEKAKKAAVNVFPIAAVTFGQKGEKITDFAALKAAGAVALSDDGSPVQNAEIARQAFIEAKKQDMLIISHCEDANMVAGGVFNAGDISKRLGLKGRPASAEEIMVARDVLLALETGARVHIAHVSTARSAEIIRLAKKAGAAVSCETCPQYFWLTEEAALEKGSLARVNPPLRTKRDVEGIIEAICDGTIDAIATDHAPHSAQEKAQPPEKAPSGMIGLETLFALSMTGLGRYMPAGEIIKRMSAAPAALLRIDKGELRPGADADIILFSPDEEWKIDPDKFFSKARNTPFGETKVKGRVKFTFVRGRIAYEDK